MFNLLYVSHELRRRAGRTILTALGLALGVGLVIGIVAVSKGLDRSQQEVLAPLNSVGTDLLVTRVAGATNATGATGTTGATGAAVVNPPGGGGFDRGGPGGNGGGPDGAGGPGFGGRGGRDGGFFGGGPGGNAALNAADAGALLNENRSAITDLASLGQPGETFTRDFFLSGTLLSFPEDAVAQVANVPGVTNAVGGMVQLVQHETGTIPQQIAQVQTGGESFEQVVRPEPMTDDERTAFRECLANAGVTIPTRGGDRAEGGPGAPGGGDGGPPPGGGGFGGGDGGGGREGNPAFDECQPARFREFRAQFITPLRTITQIVNPPTTDINNQTYTAAGIDPATPTLGLVTTEQLTAGRWIKPGASNEVLLNNAYANTKALTVGQKLTINEIDYSIVGTVNPTLTGNTADVYFPLSTLQKLSGKTGRVTQVLVEASSADALAAVTEKINTLLPGATVLTKQQLADQVTGSLSDAKDLADSFGKILAAIVLIAAFVIAMLLTLSSIAKRVREIGTLRAIGWSKGRVVRQLLGETMGIGLLGGLLGVGVGAAVVGALNQWGPTLNATTSGVPGVASGAAAAFFGQAQASVAQTTKVVLHAPLQFPTLLLGVFFALVGGLLAGLVGGWRAARLAPAEALRNLG